MKRAKLIVDDSLSIPAGELHFSASRSSGPGGQNVNKVASRVTLRFDVASSPVLNDEQKVIFDKFTEERVKELPF